MARFALRRTLSMIAVLFAVSVSTFMIFNLMPEGDPAVRLAGRQATPAQIELVRQQWGFDKPLVTQYTTMMKKIFEGSVISYSQQVEVDEQLRRGLPATISLTVGAAVIWFAIGVAFGVMSAVTAGRLPDRLLTVFAMVGISTPVFFVATLMLYYLGYKWGIFPLGDYVPLTQDPWGWFTHMLMPWAALSVLYIGVYSRVMRSTMLETFNQDYVTAARAKGLTKRQVLVRHALRNSLVPVIALWGLDIAAVLGGGAILTEYVFNLQGVGQYAAESIKQLDLPPIMVITMYGAFVVVVLSAVTDVVHAALEPRIRAE